MDGPDQSVYAVSLRASRASRAHLQYEAKPTLRRADTSSSRSHSPTSIRSSRRSFRSAPRSTTPTSATTTRALCAWVCCVPTSGSHRIRLFRFFASFRPSSLSQTRTTLSNHPLPTSTGRTASNSKRMRRTGSSVMRSEQEGRHATTTARAAEGNKVPADRYTAFWAFGEAASGDWRRTRSVMADGKSKQRFYINMDSTQDRDVGERKSPSRRLPEMW